MSLEDDDLVLGLLVMQYIQRGGDQDYDRVLEYCIAHEDHEETREIYECALAGDIDAQQQASDLLTEVFAEVEDALC